MGDEHRERPPADERRGDRISRGQRGECHGQRDERGRGRPLQGRRIGKAGAEDRHQDDHRTEEQADRGDATDARTGSAPAEDAEDDGQGRREDDHALEAAPPGLQPGGARAEHRHGGQGDRRPAQLAQAAILEPQAPGETLPDALEHVRVASARRSHGGPG